MRKLLVVSALAAVTIAVEARPALAKPEYTRKTKKDCSFCHAPGGYTLNDAGKYYREHHYTLEGYKPKPEPEKPKPSH